MKTIVITGASDGIGAELARQLAQRDGANSALVLAARNRDALDAVAEQCQAFVEIGFLFGIDDFEDPLPRSASCLDDLIKPVEPGDGFVKETERDEESDKNASVGGERFLIRGVHH